MLGREVIVERFHDVLALQEDRERGVWRGLSAK
jgi:hypothetical protein